MKRPDDGGSRRVEGLIRSERTGPRVQRSGAARLRNRMNRHVVWLVVFAVVALALGSALASIPSPQDTATFWMGNYSSPWAVLAFTAGWAQAKVRWAVTTAVAAEIACVVGFYGRFLILDMTNPTALGLPRETSSTTLLIAGLGSWVAFAGPWLIAGVGAGMIYGAIGAWWARSHPWLAGALVSLPFFIEP